MESQNGSIIDYRDWVTLQNQQPIKKEKRRPYKKTLEQTVKIDKKARSKIILSLNNSIIRDVAKEKTMAKLWVKLDRLYIKKKMFTLKLAEGSSLEEHIDEFNKVCEIWKLLIGLND